MKGALFIVGLAVTSAQAADPLPPHEAAALLQGIADASNRYSYQGTFVLQHGDRIQTLQVANKPSNSGKESRLVGMDGEQREVRCTRGESVSIVGGASPKLERRVGSRHFPDLLPPDAGHLVAWYDVRPGGMERVAGLDCRVVTLEPKDQYRWGHVLCVDKDTKLPLKEALIDAHGRPLMQYAFAEVQIRPSTSESATSPLSVLSPARLATREAPKTIVSSPVEIRQLPPGFNRVIAVKRALPNAGIEVEHWVFSDGLTQISMFVEPLARDNVNLRGAGQRGMTNLRTLRVGQSQVTVVGEAPAPAVEMIARAVTAR
jgi:sigma-E factor negative regulatory protein RseB